MKKSLIPVGFILLIAISLMSCDSKVTTKQPEKKSRTQIEMVTTKGTMLLELYDETPLHRDNFIKLANQKAFDSLLFHRVIQNFMIQGGDPESKNAMPEQRLGSGDLGYEIDAEFNPKLFHKKGVLAAARGDSKGRVSSASQFYIVQGKVYNDSLLDKDNKRINENLARHYAINDPQHSSLWDSLQKAMEDQNRETYTLYNDSLKNAGQWYTNFEPYNIPQEHRTVYKTIGGTPHLDQNYTVFGEIIKGLDVVDSIAAMPTNDYNRPLADVRILSVRVINQ
jgi:peptidyl-prolyl cis-trans isomerase B (cyclophilin B)